ncbi:MAG: OmpA family protein [Bacteroidota bacterium]
MKKSLLYLFTFVLPSLMLAQLDILPTQYNATPAHKWEVGVHAGHFFSAGDISFDPGFGAGIHLRRALDYVFSFRLEGQYGKLRGARFNGNDQFNTTWNSLSAHGIVSLNNLKWDEPNRRTNIYVYLGGGLNQFDTEFTPVRGGISDEINNARSSALDVGLGFSIRLNTQINVGIDHKFTTLFSRYADQIDGFGNQKFRDMTNYTSIRLNYNIGKKDKAEPLYWVNPLGTIISDLRTVKKRQEVGPEDNDEDGVPDYLDLEPKTPIGAIVDTRGVTLDSDQDGIPDHLDEERYSPANYEYDEKGVAIRPKYVTEEELDKRFLEQRKMMQSFFPNIHFRTNQFELRESELKKLDYVANVLKLDPDIRLMVTGYTDQQGSEQQNNELSYQRANAVIQHFLNAHNIARDRLVLNWKGEKDGIVMDEEESYMNRRVEFELATPQAKDMEPPNKKEKKKKGF